MPSQESDTDIACNTLRVCNIVVSELRRPGHSRGVQVSDQIRTLTQQSTCVWAVGAMREEWRHSGCSATEWMATTFMLPYFRLGGKIYIRDLQLPRLTRRSDVDLPRPSVVAHGNAHQYRPELSRPNRSSSSMKNHSGK